MVEAEVEDRGIPVDDIADNPTKLEEKARYEVCACLNTISMALNYL